MSNNNDRFVHQLFEPKKLKRIDSNGKRVYQTEDGGEYESVTSALSYFSRKGIHEWRKRVGAEEANKIGGRAARLGTAMHAICEDYVGNKEWKKDRSILALDRFNMIRPYLDNHCSVVHGIELQLWSSELKAAGTCDFICQYRGKNTILDFKTSSRVKTKDQIFAYFMQCAAYGIMTREHYEFDVDQLVVLMSCADGTGIEFIEPMSNWESKTRKFFDLRARGLL